MFKTEPATIIPSRYLMLTTRNDCLNDQSRGHSMGSMPLNNTVRDTKLMFGREKLQTTIKSWVRVGNTGYYHTEGKPILLTLMLFFLCVYP